MLLTEICLQIAKSRDFAKRSKAPLCPVVLSVGDLLPLHRFRSRKCSSKSRSLWTC